MNKVHLDINDTTIKEARAMAFMRKQEGFQDTVLEHLLVVVDNLQARTETDCSHIRTNLDNLQDAYLDKNAQLKTLEIAFDSLADISYQKSITIDNQTKTIRGQAKLCAQYRDKIISKDELLDEYRATNKRRIRIDNEQFQTIANKNTIISDLNNTNIKLHAEIQVAIEDERNMAVSKVGAERLLMDMEQNLKKLKVFHKLVT